MNIIRSILSVVLAGLLLISSMGFSVTRHYCMGMLVEESYYLPGESCSMKTGDICEVSGIREDLSCCEDQNLVFAGIDVKSAIEKQLHSSLTAPAVLPLSFTRTYLLDLDYQQFQNLPPPEPLPYGRDLLVQVQRFLI